MYREHFGLDQPPFRITPDTRLFYTGGRRGDVLEALVYAITSGEGIVKVVGEVGTGKTMLCRMLEEKLPDNVQIAYLANPSLTPEDILHAIALELGLEPPPGASRLQVMHRLQEALLERHAANQRVVALVEEAQSMPVDTLEEIRLLSNLETKNEKLLQIVLFGQPELDANLARDAIRQLRERITHSFALTPLARDEIRDYVGFRLRASGYRGRDVFTDGAYRRMARASEGLTRRVNVIADKAMLAAFAEGSHEVSARHVRVAVRDSEFDAGRRRAAAGRVRIALAAGASAVAVLAGAAGWYAGRSLPPDAIVVAPAAPAADAAAFSQAAPIAAALAASGPVEVAASGPVEVAAPEPIVAASAPPARPEPASGGAEPAAPPARSDAADRTPPPAVLARVEPAGAVPPAPAALPGGGQAQSSATSRGEPPEGPATGPRDGVGSGVDARAPAPEATPVAEPPPAAIGHVPDEAPPGESAPLRPAPRTASAGAAEAAGSAAPDSAGGEDGSAASGRESAANVVPVGRAVASREPLAADAAARAPERADPPDPPADPPDPPDASAREADSGGVLSQRLAVTRDWLRDVDERHYSIQLLATDARQRRNLEHFLRVRRESGQVREVYVYRTMIRGRPWYGVLYGEYTSFSEAREALDGLPTELRRHQPFIRNIRDIAFLG